MLLLESVALNRYPVNGLPDTPVVDDLTVKLVSVFETSVGALGVPGGGPLVVDALNGALVLGEFPLFNVVLTLYALLTLSPVIVPV